MFRTLRLTKKFGFSVFLSRKSDHSASGAMIALTIRLNSTQLPVELSRIGRSDHGLRETIFKTLQSFNSVQFNLLKAKGPSPVHIGYIAIISTQR